MKFHRLVAMVMAIATCFSVLACAKGPRERRDRVRLSRIGRK